MGVSVFLPNKYTKNIKFISLILFLFEAISSKPASYVQFNYALIENWYEHRNMMKVCVVNFDEFQKHALYRSQLR